MQDRSTAEALWDKVREPLRDELGDATWKAWFAAAEPVREDNGTFELSVPADLYKRTIEDRFLPQLEFALTEITGMPLTAEIVVTVPQRHGDLADLSPTSPMSAVVHTTNVSYPAGADEMAPATSSVPEVDDHTTAAPADSSSRSPQVLPHHTFDNFIIGDSNRFAHAAALAVAESPASGYNPLFIWGGTGLGKTHLLHAIVNYVRDISHMQAIYTSSEQFTNEFIEMIRSDRRTQFRDRYRSADILLIDDIQFLAGKVETQNEFFFTFNHLHQSNRQIVIASDRPPKEISHLEDRLRSRFEWGLLTDIQPPDLETRIAILRNKAERSNLSVPPDVIEFIAHRISDNIRELEGALNRVAAYAKLEGVLISMERAEDLLAGIGNAGRRQVTSDLIIKETASYYGLEIDELVGPSRRRPLVQARQVSMYLHRELTELSYPRIGEIFEGRDHTTVLHAVRKIETLMHEKRALLQQVTELANRIKLG